MWILYDLYILCSSSSGTVVKGQRVWNQSNLTNEICSHNLSYNWRPRDRSHLHVILMNCRSVYPTLSRQGTGWQWCHSITSWCHVTSHNEFWGERTMKGAWMLGHFQYDCKLGCNYNNQGLHICMSLNFEMKFSLVSGQSLLKFLLVFRAGIYTCNLHAEWPLPKTYYMACCHVFLLLGLFSKHLPSILHGYSARHLALRIQHVKCM